MIKSIVSQYWGGANIFSIGYGGVDIFLFYSGFGLYYSWKNNSDIKVFYKKRFIRIIPMYWIAVIVLWYLILDYIPLKDIPLLLSTLGFWVSRRSEWYISAIIAFYIIFPFFIQRFEKTPIKSVLLFGSFGILCSMLIGIFHLSTVIYFTSRMSIFAIGVFLASQTYYKKEIPANLLILLSAICFVIMMVLINKLDDTTLLKTALYFYPFIFIVPGLCIFFTNLFDKFKCKYLRVLSSAGNYSLELFLAHGKMLIIIPIAQNNWNFSIYASVLVWLVCTLLASIFLHYSARVLTHILPLLYAKVIRE